MIEGAVKRGLLVAVVVLISCILGLVASLNIPVQMIPDLEVRTISVRTGWPGATPQDIEKEILIEQERYLRSLPNLKRMTSYGEMGSGTIELEFPFGVDVSDALIRVNNALSQVPAYPENVDQPRITSSSFSSNAFMYFRLRPLPGNPMQLDMDLLRDYADDYIRPRMESVEGVSEVRVGGGAARQIQIMLDPARIAQRSISISDVRNAIRTRNRDASAGDMESGENRYLIRVVGRFESVQQLGELIVDESEGSIVRLRDVADIKLDHFETRSLSFSDGERNLSLSVRRESGSNVLNIKADMLPIVEELNQTMLEQNGLEMVLLSDDVQYVSASLRNVWTNLGLGAGLATLVMFFFLRSRRATLVGVMGIPICTIAAFLALELFGRTINVISLAGVAFAIGMTVDNTVVVLESIVQQRRKGLSSQAAAIAGVREVWPAVLASTATTVLVFAPILFVVQEAGQLYSDIAIAISGAIVASMLVALFVVPAALAVIDVRDTEAMALEQGRKRLIDFSQRFFSTPKRATVAALAMGLAIPVAALILMPPAEYLPEGEEPKAFSIMIAPPNYNLSEMEKIGAELRQYFDGFVLADETEYSEGNSPMPPLAYYSMSVSVGRIWVLSAPVDPDHIGDMMTAITDKFKSFDNMRAFSSRGSIISSNDGGTRAVAIDIAGNDITELYAAAEAVYQEAEVYFEDPQINSDPRSLTLNQPMIEIHPRWHRLAENGISNGEFTYTVAAMSDGAFVDEVILGDDKIDVFLFSKYGNEQTIDGLAATPIATPNGDILPLDSLAVLKESKSSNSVRRVDSNRTVTVFIIPPRNVALETAEQIVRTRLIPSLWQQGKIAQGTKLSISGAADQLDATRASLGNNFLIAIVLSYLLLVAILNHWRFPLYILATIPLGMAGGLFGLVLVNGVTALLDAVGLRGVHQPFDMITMLGFLILLGTVVNNPILIVDQVRRLVNEGANSVKDAVDEAIRRRLQPILISTSTTIFGLAPLVLIPGEGTELYRGVGIIVLSGIFVSTLISLTFLPAVLVATIRAGESLQGSQVRGSGG